VLRVRPGREERRREHERHRTPPPASDWPRPGRRGRPREPSDFPCHRRAPGHAP
jgi:hypothetical protein